MSLARSTQALRLISRAGARPAVSAARAGSPVARFHASASVAADPKEQAEAAEREKQSGKQPQQDHKGWKEDLASDSEDAVKADRDETHSESNDIKKMQEQTEDKPRQKHGQ